MPKCSLNPLRSGRMGYSWGAVILLAAFFLSALLFSTAMLSTSTVMPDSGAETCGGIKPVDQVVLVLVDAMRPDFVLSALRRYSRTDGGCRPLQEDGDGDVVPDYYSGPTLRYMQDAMGDTSDASHGFFLVADAPTTTAQRIKAIATGTMPAFLEAGSNFNSDATPLDSFVRQAGGRAVILGDDTWTKLFPGEQHWKRMVDIPSFDVADFHTNDDAVLATVFDVLETERAEAAADQQPYAKLIVAHFLGIDHVGHRINAANREMDAKIRQLNLMLHNISNTLRTRDTAMNTMLLVLGDHGMTQNGDHGGDSALETDTFLFAQYFRGSRQLPASYRETRNTAAMTAMDAKKAAVKAAMAAVRQEEAADHELVRLNSCRAVAGVDTTQLGAAYQVDVTPTVSVLLGQPIPFSSFGRVIPEVVALADAEADLEEVDRCNERQMMTYFTESKMDLPAHPPWQGRDEMTTRQRIAAMSFYARRTRTDMNMPCVLAGLGGLVACALSALLLPDIRAIVFPPASPAIAVAMVALVVRWAMTLSNSFIVNEDIGVFGLFVFCFLTLYGARRVGENASAQKSAAVVGSTAVGRRAGAAPGLLRAIGTDTLLCGFLISIAVARGFLPFVLKHRFHITHAVEGESALGLWVRPFVWGPGGPVAQRLGLTLGAVVWAALQVQLHRRRTTLVEASRSEHVSQRKHSEPGQVRTIQALALLTLVVMAAAHNIPVVHHLASIGLAVGYVSYLRSGCNGKQVMPASLAVPARDYVYFLWTLWNASLCNELIVASAVIAVYGATLPFVVATLQESRQPPALVAMSVHLLSFIAFFMQGHQCLLSTIDWNASFVGMPAYSMICGGILVVSRTFNAFLLPPVACRVAERYSGGGGTKGRGDFCATCSWS